MKVVWNELATEFVGVVSIIGLAEFCIAVNPAISAVGVTNRAFAVLRS